MEKVAKVQSSNSASMEDALTRIATLLEVGTGLKNSRHHVEVAICRVIFKSPRYKDEQFDLARKIMGNL